MKSTPQRVVTVSFQHFAGVKMCVKKCNDEKVFFLQFNSSLNLAIFNHCTYKMMVYSAYFVNSCYSYNLQFIPCILCKYATDILNMYMKRFYEQ